MGVWSPLDDVDDAEKKKKEEKVKMHPTVEDLEQHNNSVQFQNSNNYSTIVFSNVEESLGEQVQFPDPQYSRRAQQIRRIYLNGSPELKTPRSSRPVTAATTKSMDVLSDRDQLRTPATDLNFEPPVEEPPLPYQILKKVSPPHCHLLLPLEATA